MSPEPASKRPGEPRQADPGQEASASELEALAAEVEQVPPLRPGEQPALLERIRRGPDEAAVARLLESHLGMVLKLAHTRKGRGLSIGDLFQEGSVGLLASIRAFPAAGADDFERFSAAQVALAMEDALATEAEELRREQLLIQALADYDRVEMALAGELHRAPTVIEIGTKLEWSPERTEQIRGLIEEARRRHDEEIALYLEADEIGELPAGDDFGLN
jgi:DNA-directed RNA polymerase sigma subunit (sigma70/sigma32)